MLEFAVEHREALDSITGNRAMKLRQYELTEEDWMIATKLRDVLKVRYYLLLIVSLFHLPTKSIHIDLQGCDSVLLAWHP